MHEISLKDAMVQMKQTTKLPQSTLDALMTLFYPSVLFYVLHNTFYSQFKIRMNWKFTFLMDVPGLIEDNLWVLQV